MGCTVSVCCAAAALLAEFVNLSVDLGLNMLFGLGDKSHQTCEWLIQTFSVINDCRKLLDGTYVREPCSEEFLLLARAIPNHRLIR